MDINTGDVFFTGFALIGFVLWLIPILFILWFTLTTVKQLKLQTALLEKMNDRLDTLSAQVPSKVDPVLLEKKDESGE